MLASVLLPTAYDGLCNNLVQIHTKYYKLWTSNTFFFPGKLMLEYLLWNEWYDAICFGLYFEYQYAPK